MRYTSALHFALAVIVTSTPVQAKIINVPADSTTIQAAINGASNGDTVLVQPGTYVENINFNGKDIIVGSLLITTDDTSYIRQTVIDGGQSDRVVTMNMGETSSASLVGLTIQNGSKWWGAGILCDNSSSPSLDHLSVINNSVEGGVNGTGGGGICCLNNSNPSISNSVISHNTVTPWDGGGIFTHNSSPTISNTIIYGNVAEREGGAIFVGGSSNPILSDVLVYSNSGLTGGGLYFGGANGTLMNMTIHDNYSQNGGGIVINDGGDPVIVNTILWDNEPYQIFFHIGWPSSFSIAYSNVAGGLDNIGNPGNGTVNWLEGNIDSTPFFNSHETEDYSLLDHSPCIGSGIDSIQIDGSWYYAPSTDIEGNTRPNPPGSNPDMGAYENSRAIALPRIEIVPSSIAFGSIKIGTNSSDTLLVMSVSTGETLDVSSISSSNPAFTASPSSFSVLPGDSATVVVTFSPTDMVTYSDSLTIASNDPQQPEVKVYLSGTGLPISATIPAANSASASTTTDVSVTFGLDIASSSTINSGTFVVYGSQSGLHNGNYIYNSATWTATFTSNTPYMVGEVVSVILTMGTGLPSPYSWTFHVATEGGSGKFIQTDSLATGSNLRDVVAGDWDGDGDVDLAVSGDEMAMDYYVRIWTNDGTGGFTQTSSLQVDNGPYALAAGDWDEDGNQDLAVTQEWGSSITILTNDGTGAFTKTVSVSVGQNPTAITPGDWDGDGDPDLAVVNTEPSTISILINGGWGIFTATSTIGVGNYPQAITPRDWDNDGDIDLAVSNSNSNSISILLNDGDGNFNLASTLSVSGNSYDIAAGDWNGDGDPDLASANSWNNSVSILTNDGGANFSQDSTLYLNHNAYKLETGDLDGDGSLDLFVVSSDTASVLMNDGLGGFTKSAQDMGGGTGLVLGDWDNDGDLDAAIIDYNTINILTNRNRAAQATLSAKTLAYGATTIGGSAELNFTVYNHGVDSTLRVSGITASNSVYEPSPTALDMLPDSSATVTVTFTPTTIAIYNDSLTFSTNDPDQPEVKVYVSGYGFPIAGHTPAANALAVSVGSDISVTFSVDMAEATIDANTFVVHGGCTGRLSGDYNYNEGTKTATFSPGAPFTVGEQVSVTLTTGVTSVESIPLPTPLYLELPRRGPGRHQPVPPPACRLRCGNTR